MNERAAAERTSAKAAWSLLLAMAPPATTLAALPVTLRQLGVAQYGILQVSLGIAGLMGMADLNFGLALTRQVAWARGAGEDASVAAFMRTGLTLFAGIGFAASVTTILTAPWLASSFVHASGLPVSYAVDSVRLAGAVLLPMFVATYATGTANGFHRFVVPAGMNAMNLVLTTLGGVVLAVKGADVRGLMAWNAIVSYFFAWVLLAYTRRLGSLGRRSLGFDHVHARTLLQFAAFSWMGRAASLIVTAGDRLVVSATLGAVNVPLYAIPMTLIRYVSGAGTTLGAVLFPIAANLKARDGLGQLRTMYVRAARVFATLAVGPPLMAAVGADSWLGSWLGPEFRGSAATVLTLGSILTTVSLLTVVASYVVDGLGKPHLTGTLRLVQSVVGLALAVVLTRAWGVVGTATAFLLPAAITAPLFLRLVEGRHLQLAGAEAVRTIYARPVLVGALVVLGTRAVMVWLDPASVAMAGLALLVAILWYAAAVLLIRPIPFRDLRTLIGSRRFLLSPLRADEAILLDP